MYVCMIDWNFVYVIIDDGVFLFQYFVIDKLVMC